MIIACLLLVLASWVCFEWGNLFTHALNLVTAENATTENQEKTMLFGLAFLAWLTALLHFFLPIDKGIQSSILLVGIGNTLLFPENRKKYLKWLSQGTTLILLVIATLAISGRPGFGDIADYHLQAIKWAEHYPNILGLGNFNRPLANNNWWFNLQAVFGFGIGNLKSIYCLNPLLAVISLSWCLQNLKQSKGIEKGLNWGLLLFTVLSFKTAFAGSVSPDFPIAILVIFTAIESIQTMQQSNTISAFLKLALLVCFAISIKLNALPLLALLVVVFILNFNFSTAWRLLIFGSLYLLPWLIGNMIVSGWLAYPIHQIDLFSFDWKVPAAVLEFERFSIMQWGKIPGAPIMETAKLSFTEWLPIWFNQHDWANKIVMLTVLAAILLILVKRKTYQNKQLLLLLGFGVFGLLFCISNGPHIRYAFGYFWLLIGLGLGVYTDLPYKKSIQFLVLGASLALAGMKSYSHHYAQNAWLLPDPYPLIELNASQMGIEKVIINKQNSSCWDQFPCTYYLVPGCELRKGTFAEGFKTNPSNFKTLFEAEFQMP